MNEGLADPSHGDSVEAGLRRGLARCDVLLAAIVPVLRHLLDTADNALFAEVIVARLRGMLEDIASQLVAAVAASGVEMDQARVTLALIDCPDLLRHLHAGAVEWHLAARLADHLGLDPVLSPLLQALIASPDAATADAAMRLLAAQARFVQAQRRMRQPVHELPGDVMVALIGLLAAHLAVLAEEGGHDPAVAELIATEAAQRLRAGYDEGASRLGLLARLVSAMGAGVGAALSITHAGVELFATALAQVTSQSREICVLATQEGQLERLSLSLRAAGLRVTQVEDTLLALHPGAMVARGLGRVGAERAAALLAGGVRGMA